MIHDSSSFSEDDEELLALTANKWQFVRDASEFARI